MSPLFHRPLGVAALGLTLLAGPLAAHAQMGSRIDPQARTLLDEMAAAHQALSGLKATVVVRSYGAGSDRGRTITFAFRRPNQAKAAVADRTGPLAQLSADGKNLIVYSVHNKQYTRQASPAGPDAIAEVLGQTGALLPAFLARPAVLTRVLVRPGVRVARAGAGTVAGVAVDIVTVTSPVTRRGPGLTLSLAVGRKDHLLRRLTESAPGSPAGPKAMHTETVTRLKADPALTVRDFAFTPPAGVKKLAQTAQQAMHDPRLVPGARPFPIQAKDLAGQPLSLAQYRGKVVLMDFWATWCPPCVGEMPNVIAAYKKYHAQGFDVLGISLDQNRGALTSFLKQNAMPWRQVFDGKYWQSVVPRQYGVRSIPFGLLIGRDGRIVAVEVGGPDLAPAIQQALAKKTATR
jgi:thiol-disulfide isomerase/thioredoxin